MPSGQRVSDPRGNERLVTRFAPAHDVVTSTIAPVLAAGVIGNASAAPRTVVEHRRLMAGHVSVIAPGPLDQRSRAAQQYATTQQYSTTRR